MGILYWDKPKKLRPTEEHNAIYKSDCEVAGTYVPNMDRFDEAKWKAKKLGGRDPRVEIRKTVTGPPRGNQGWGCGAQVVLVVRPDGYVMFSSNGKADFDFDELAQAVREAREALKKDVVPATNQV